MFRGAFLCFGGVFCALAAHQITSLTDQSLCLQFQFSLKRCVSPYSQFIEIENQTVEVVMKTFLMATIYFVLTYDVAYALIF